MGGVEGNGAWLLMGMWSFCGVRKISPNWLWLWLHNYVNILKAIELCTLNGWILCYVTYISRELLWWEKPRESKSVGCLSNRSLVWREYRLWRSEMDEVDCSPLAKSLHRMKAITFVHPVFCLVFTHVGVYSSCFSRLCNISLCNRVNRPQFTYLCTCSGTFVSRFCSYKTIL